MEVTHLINGHVGVRDSKNVSMPALGFTPTAWRRFAGEVKRDLQGRR